MHLCGAADIIQSLLVPLGLPLLAPFFQRQSWLDWSSGQIIPPASVPERPVAGPAPRLAALRWLMGVLSVANVSEKKPFSEALTVAKAAKRNRIAPLGYSRDAVLPLVPGRPL